MCLVTRGRVARDVIKSTHTVVIFHSFAFIWPVERRMTDPELKQWSNFRAAVRGEVGVHQQKREWIWGPCVT